MLVTGAILGGALIGFTLLLGMLALAWLLLAPLLGLDATLAASFFFPLLPLALLPGGQFAWQTLAARGYARGERIACLAPVALLFLLMIVALAYV